MFKNVVMPSDILLMMSAGLVSVSLQRSTARMNVSRLWRGCVRESRCLTSTWWR